MENGKYIQKYWYYSTNFQFWMHHWSLLPVHCLPGCPRRIPDEPIKKHSNTNSNYNDLQLHYHIYCFHIISIRDFQCDSWNKFNRVFNHLSMNKVMKAHHDIFDDASGIQNTKIYAFFNVKLKLYFIRSHSSIHETPIFMKSQKKTVKLNHNPPIIIFNRFVCILNNKWIIMENDLI